MTDDTHKLPNGEIDRATWKRLSSGRDGCEVSGCTHSPVISLTVSAVELTGSRGGGNLAKQTLRYCAPHAEQRFVATLAAMKGQRTER